MTISAIPHTSDSFAAEALDCRLQKLVCDARCQGGAEWHASTFVFDAVEHDSEVLGGLALQ